MKTTKNLLVAVALSVGLFSATGANAVLTLSADGTVVNDDVSGLTWLANANLAASNTFGVSGIATSGAMTWNTAQSWIGAMNAASYLGFNDWRLASGENLDGSGVCNSLYSYNCVRTEFATLYYAQTIMVFNPGPFQNLLGGNYWTSSDLPSDSTKAMAQDFIDGGQNPFDKSSYGLAWAMRDGLQVVSPVPEPETYAMLLAGLGLLGFTAKRRKGRIV